jgi:hypothetical protein
MRANVGVDRRTRSECAQRARTHLCVRVEQPVMRSSHSLKEMITIRAIVVSAEHAAPLETEDPSHMGMGHYGQASPRAPCHR